MRDDSDSPHKNCLRVSFFQQKNEQLFLATFPTSIKISYLKLLSYVHSMLWTYSMKKLFISVSLLLFTKKIR